MTEQELKSDLAEYEKELSDLGSKLLQQSPAGIRLLTLRDAVVKRLHDFDYSDAEIITGPIEEAVIDNDAFDAD